MTFLHTARGLFSLIEPAPALIDIRDIAHRLALINRFGGDTPVPYSVAQHSVHVAQDLAEARMPVAIQLAGLLHDAHEAFTGDVITPVAEALFGDDDALPSPLDVLKATLDRAIFKGLGLAMPSARDWDDITFADRRLLNAERIDLRGEEIDGPRCRFAVRPWAWPKAEEKFLTLFHRLHALSGAAPRSASSQP